MMNQAASATRRAPADSTPAGCCPMLNAPFFGLSTPAAAPQCFLSSQAQQLVQLARQPQQQSNVVLPPQQQTVSQQPPTLSGQQHQLQTQPQQLTTQRSHDQTSNNYNTSITAPGLVHLQHILANRHSASSCVALAAALANFPPFQQQQQQQQQLLTQNHQATPISQQTQTVAPSTAVNQVTHPNAPPTLSNQVPILNYNSYPSAQPFINLPTLAVPQSAPPPVAAYLGHQQQQQQQTNGIPNILSSNLDTIAQNTLSNSANNLHQNVQQPRPLITNSSLNSSASQLSNSIYRSAQQQSTEQQAPNIHHLQQQPPSTPTPAQQLGHVTRSISSDDTLNIFNDQFQAMLLNQLFSTHQFPPSLVAPQLQSQQIAAPQQLLNPSRTQTTLPLSGQSPIVMAPAQQVTSTQIVPPQQHQPSLEQASENHQQQQQTFSHSTIQSRVNQAPQPPTNDSYRSSVNNTASGSYQSHPNNDPHVQRPPSNPVLQAHQGPQTSSQAPPSLQPQSHQQQQQHPQPQSGLPPMPFYTYPQDGSMDQALALLADPRVTQNLFGHIFMILRNNLRTEPHHTHHHHPTHHFHHLHGAHNHHHGQNGQTNGQDASMPLDSLAINESKPRGLSRAEIDSLTPYIHTNEKDARTCVICLSKFELKSKIRPLPCNHAFHAKCVDKWLRTNRTCPICRRDALKTFNGKIKRI